MPSAAAPIQVHKKKVPEFIGRRREMAPFEVHEPRPKAPCPCEALGLLDGKHQIDGGHCIDGVFYTDVEVNGMKHVRLAMKADSGRASMMISAIMRMKKEFDLDIEKATINHVP